MLISALAIFGSCTSFSVDSFENSSWAMRDRGDVMGTVRIISVSAEKSGELGSLEKEISDLLPLLFSEEAYLVIPSSSRADYSAEVKVREREYPHGWQTQRSLSAEVRIWAGEEGGPSGQPLPLSAGRALIQGKKSLASSKTLSGMLRSAVKNAVRGLGGK